MQGQGDGTKRKQVLFYHASALGMRIVARNMKLRGYPFWLFDGNCGSGWNDQVGVIGSPITAHSAADSVGLATYRRRFHFCDRDRMRMLELHARLAAVPAWEASSYLSIGDNEEGLALFAECIIQAERQPEKALGAVIIDPNGWFYRSGSNEGPAIHGLQTFTQQFERIDVVLNLNLLTYWRSRGKGFDVLPPSKVLAVLHRRHWLVGEISIGQARFWIAIGRNLKTDDHRSVGLFHIESEQGQRIMRFAERNEHPIRQGDLFDASRVAALSNLPEISQAPGVPRGAGAGDEARQSQVPLWRASD